MKKEKEKACSLSRYTATKPAGSAAMGIQIPSGEEKSAKQIQKSKMMQQIALIKKKEKKSCSHATNIKLSSNIC